MKLFWKKEIKHSADNLLEDLHSPNKKRRISSLSSLSWQMWAEDPIKRASAIKLVAGVLEHTDIDMVQKSASYLAERGPIGVRYLEIVAEEKEISEFARSIIRIRIHLAGGQRRHHVDLSEDKLYGQIQGILSEAMSEAQHHKFSSFFGGTMQCHDLKMSYAFEIDLRRPIDAQAWISFIYVGSDTRVRDEDCIPVVKIFSNNQKYKELGNLPSQFKTPPRYFVWGITEA